MHHILLLHIIAENLTIGQRQLVSSRGEGRARPRIPYQLLRQTRSLQVIPRVRLLWRHALHWRGYAFVFLYTSLIATTQNKSASQL